MPIVDYVLCLLDGEVGILDGKVCALDTSVCQPDSIMCVVDTGVGLFDGLLCLFDFARDGTLDFAHFCRVVLRRVVRILGRFHMFAPLLIRYHRWVVVFPAGPVNVAVAVAVAVVISRLILVHHRYRSGREVHLLLDDFSRYAVDALFLLGCLCVGLGLGLSLGTYDLKQKGHSYN